MTEPVRVIERTIFFQQDEGAIPYAPRRGDEYQGWHCDDTFCARIPLAATLRPLVIPTEGGDTCWASMGAAFDALSPSLQQWLETLDADLPRRREWAAKMQAEARQGQSTEWAGDDRDWTSLFSSGTNPVRAVLIALVIWFVWWYW